MIKNTQIMKMDIYNDNFEYVISRWQTNFTVHVNYIRLRGACTKLNSADRRPEIGRAGPVTGVQKNYTV